MSAYNTVSAELRCPHCGGSTRTQVQFKYGDTWQFDYRLGDTLRWGGNDIGEPGRKHVVVDGAAANPCSRCGYSAEWNAYVHVENDVLARVEDADGSFDFAAARANYIVVCP